ncbi:glucose-6-phosphate dehydrogenase [Candidatus Solirubrobacter pratensis]|uniref:glucose-6-phosphate dehydrogenase n=1 Tax=Candidatus Solirubrobacter pratensis TaxID=1298857 RepID=UPI0004850EE1|nr:glucose-6-phosphate dehydrogenase [Candidatus Solirubrobacter pratensis]
MAPLTTTSDPHVLVLFGARGDLARRKLWPGLRRLAESGFMPDDYRIIGSGRHAPDDGFIQALGDEAFTKRISFVTSSADDGEDLARAVREAREALGERSRTLLYLSVPPSAMKPMVGMLGRTGLDDERTRIVLEKPFGSDLASAKALNAALHEHFDERAIFRIDHFLGKEPVQDILALRFANGLFEPIWNNEHVASVQIDIPEDLGLEGRGSFYEETGAFRDMVVTHLSQILGFVAMEPPETLDAGHLRDAKAAAFADLRPFSPEHAVYGQFEGYRDEDGVASDSRTETFAALRVELDNDRWRGVPFLLRTGKAMAAGRRVVTVALRDPAQLLLEADGDGAERPDELVVELTDDPRIAVELRVKRPGPTLVATRAAMELDVERATGGHGLEAYERLLIDVMHGDHLLFTRADEVELLWERAAPLLQAPPEPLPYARGSWGPEAAEALAGRCGWRLS